MTNLQEPNAGSDSSVVLAVSSWIEREPEIFLQTLFLCQRRKIFFFVKFSFYMLSINVNCTIMLRGNYNREI